MSARRVTFLLSVWIALSSTGCAPSTYVELPTSTGVSQAVPADSLVPGQKIAVEPREGRRFRARVARVSVDSLEVADAYYPRSASGTRRRASIPRMAYAWGELLSIELVGEPFRPWASLAPGDRVRVTTTSASLDHAVLAIVSRQDDTLVAEDPVAAGARITVPVRTLQSLDVSHGEQRHTMKGLLLGFGGGFVLGVIAAQANDWLDESEEEALFALMFAAGGGVVGSVAGTAVVTERWQEVAIPTQD